MAAMFEARYASRHEASHGSMIRAILARNRGATSFPGAARFLLQRDSQLQLEMDSSQLNAPFIDVLAGLFPAAKFILTVREPRAFLRSIIDHQLARPASKSWKLLRDFRFGGFTHSEREHVLAERGLYPLDAYLSYWAAHNQNVLTTVPPHRLLILRTDEIQASIPRLAAFLDIPAETITASAGKAYAAERRFEILEQIDPHFVEDRIEAHCGKLLRDLLEVTHGTGNPSALEHFDRFIESRSGTTPFRVSTAAEQVNAFMMNSGTSDAPR